MNRKNTGVILIFGCIIFLVFFRWFTTKEIIGGDWPFFFTTTLKDFPLISPPWNPWQANGLGGVDPIYFLNIFLNFSIFLSSFTHLPWVVIYKVLWFGFFIALSIGSSIYFSKVVLSTKKLIVHVLSALVFTTNTYILMVTEGGQMGVALAYAISPLVLAKFIQLIHMENLQKSFKLSLVAGLILAIQVMFDPRISFITMIGVIGYLIFMLRLRRARLMEVLVGIFLVPLCTVAFLHMSWILPSLLFHYNSLQLLGKAYTDSGSFKFFSFADFSHSLSFLQPNWPENIFGKTYFLYPQFIIVAIIAYSSLLFTKNRKLLYFVFLGLLGSFLAKGAQEPFGFVNIWLFEHIPGFVLFRDPTKFYLLIALAYSILIPFSLQEVIAKLNNNKRYIAYSIFVIFWLFLIHQAVLGQLGGTFVQHGIPQEYYALEKYLNQQQVFFRTLWVPRQSRFAFYSANHPATEAVPLFGNQSFQKTLQHLNSQDTRQYLNDLSIKYVIVPYDVLGEIFVKDRKYDDIQYESTIKGIEKISWLHRINDFGRIAVFQNDSYKNHFWLTNSGDLSVMGKSQDEYLLHISLKKPTHLIFSESYSPFWVMYANGKEMVSQKTNDALNSFFLKPGEYNAKIYFKEKIWFTIGWIISGVALLGIVFGILFL